MSTHRTPALSRRTFLRGTGAALALPFLEAMHPGTAHAAMEAPRRFIAYYVPCGIHMPNWTPATEGAGFAMTPILKPLEAYKSDLLVLSGLANRPAKPDGPGDHASGTGAFITAAHPFKTEGSDIRNGVSLDQYIAQELDLKSTTRFGSLQLGMSGGGSTGGCDSGYSCAYARNISWASEQTPVPKQTDVQRAFDYIFSGIDPQATAAAIARRKAFRQSMLDFVREDATNLQKKLGARDKAKLDEYLTGLRDLEIRVNQDTNGPICAPPAIDGGGTSFSAKAKLMADIMATAIECDLTRVMTFMLDNAGSGRNYQAEAGVMVSGNHHEISHHQSLQENYDKLTLIDTWEVAQLAYLVGQLKSRTDVDGNSLLHNTTIFFSSEISDGNRHNHDDMPILVVGQGGGQLKTGRHIRYNSVSVANLFVSIANNMGVQTNSFGMDSTGPLTMLT
jgi:hypothetical protein